MTEAGVIDARGCLTAAGLARLESAAPGQAPPELAAHLSGCASCQERLLRRERQEGKPAAARPGRSAHWRNLTLMLIALLVALLLLSFTLASLRNQ